MRRYLNLIAFVLLTLGFSWIQPRHAKAGCPPRRGASPVIATSFAIKEPRLLAKLNKTARSKLETDLSEVLAGELRCIRQPLGFLEWLSTPVADEQRRAGFLQAYLKTRGSGRRYAIEVHFGYRIGSGELISLEPPAKLLDLYSPEERRGPGSGGKIWKDAIRAHFHKLLNEDDGIFRKSLYDSFLQTPLTKRGDLLFYKNPQLKGVALPIYRTDLQAKDGSELFIPLEDPNGLTVRVELKTACFSRDPEWINRVQCQVAGSDQNLRILKNKAPEQIYLNKYEWGDPRICRGLDLGDGL